MLTFIHVERCCIKKDLHFNTLSYVTINNFLLFLDFEKQEHLFNGPLVSYYYEVQEVSINIALCDMECADRGRKHLSRYDVYRINYPRVVL